MAANTTVKVATLTGAAKDDVFTSAATGLTEDHAFATLNVLANDPGAAKLYSLAQNTSGLTSTSQFPVVTSAVLASGASITVHADGTVGYDASGLQASLQHLAAGEFFTDSFTYTVRMANGALSTATATVSIAGLNDAPTLAGVAAASILDTAADDAPAAVTGTLAGADVDHGAVLTYGFADGVAFTVAADGTLVSATDNGTLSLNAQTGAYSFLADPDKIDSLAAGVNADASFVVKVTDEHGASSSSVNLSFTLVGANDTAEISGTANGSVTEDGTLTARGALQVADRDAGQSAFQAPASLAGTYGDFTFDATSGEWTYTLRNGDANVQALTSAQTVSDELVITSLDGSASQTIHVDIGGADEAVSPPVPPVVNPVTDFMVNNGLSFVNGKATFVNFDANDRLLYSNNFDLTAITTVDTDGNGTPDSSAAMFEFHHGRDVTPVEIILVGYTGLTDAQVVSA
ncbi:MAG TPA: VCBS domain-containing protein [Noviherbaspirillum sp.]|uniref:VCBS domain-containing protein n=1 Tax=Noviherbaspirillum sp. TaxID=1926288 RepID=UPI002B484440|nr:VCBS domain-containing protein [Noviherbaspirillum sp.]HJV86412.1 VCBS domain-containing protein [Noviherbaspirillum sp.]